MVVVGDVEVGGISEVLVVGGTWEVVVEYVMVVIVGSEVVVVKVTEEMIGPVGSVGKMTGLVTYDILVDMKLQLKVKKWKHERRKTKGYDRDGGGKWRQPGSHTREEK